MRTHNWGTCPCSGCAMRRVETARTDYHDAGDEDRYGDQFLVARYVAAPPQVITGRKK